MCVFNISFDIGSFNNIQQIIYNKMGQTQSTNELERKNISYGNQVARNTNPKGLHYEQQQQTQRPLTLGPLTNIPANSQQRNTQVNPQQRNTQINPQQRNTQTHPQQNQDFLSMVFNKDNLQMQLEKFRFPDPYIKYKIMPAEEEKMSLDITTIDNGKDLIKGDVIIWEYHGGPNQQFYFKRHGDYKFQIINVATGFSLEIPDNNFENEVPVVSNPRSGTPNEIFQVKSVGAGIYSIRTFCGKSLDVKHHFLRNGSAVIQYEYDEKKRNQKWKIWPG